MVQYAVRPIVIAVAVNRTMNTPIAFPAEPRQVASSTRTRMRISIDEAMAFEVTPLLFDRFEREYSMSGIEARELFQEVKKFLIVIATFNGFPFAPSRRVDKMWHSFILFTSDYVKFCDSLGGYLHHMPAERGLPKIRKMVEVIHGYVNSLVGIKSLFGNINEKWWPTEFHGLLHPQLSGNPTDVELINDAMSLDPPPIMYGELQKAVDEFRIANSLLDIEETQDWLRAMNLDVERFTEIIKWNLRLTKFKAEITRDRLTDFLRRKAHFFELVQFFRVGGLTIAEATDLIRKSSQAHRGLYALISAQALIANRHPAEGVLTTRLACDLPENFATAQAGSVIGPVVDAVEAEQFWIAEILRRRRVPLKGNVLKIVEDHVFGMWLTERRGATSVV